MKRGTIEDFNKLPLQTKLDVLAEFTTYSKVHLEEWADGTIKVTPDFCLMADSYEKPKLTFEFYKEDFKEEEIAVAYFLLYNERFDRKKHEATMAEYYAY